MLVPNSVDPNPTDALDVLTFERLADDPHARRELLWALSMIQGDTRAARSLEAVDLGLAKRLAPVVARHWLAARAHGSSEPASPAFYEAIWSERFDHHRARYLGVLCCCPECARAA
ncbi:MAG: hypothetical protein IPI67_33720 [Myxococcales bacterium]|nr:hypothetical protein [Myxococcales bacterium]